VWLQGAIGLGVATDEYWVNASGMNSLNMYDGEKRENFKQEDLKGHGHNSMDICASRALFEWSDVGKTNSYNWHEFQASKTLSGPLDPSYWWDLIYRYNTEVAAYAGTDDVWNAFLHMGTHLYVRDLAAHVKAFEEDGTRYLARRYKARGEGDEGKTMFVALISNPFNGNVIAIHAQEVSVSALEAKFTTLEATACAYAVALPYSLSRLDKWFNDVYDTKVDSRGRARAIPVMDSVPTFDVDAVELYWGEDGLKVHSLGATTSLHSETDGTGNVCKVYEINVATQFQTAYQARFVYTPSARAFDEVGRFNSYRDAQVRAAVGFNEGYSRWMDEHWAFELKDSHTLDQLRLRLEETETPYHAHVTELIGKMTTGSLWSWSVSGLGVEWHGAIDYTTFSKPIGGFDFCTVDTTCQASDIDCIDVANITANDDDDDLVGASSVNSA